MLKQLLKFSFKSLLILLVCSHVAYGGAASLGSAKLAANSKVVINDIVPEYKGVALGIWIATTTENIKNVSPASIWPEWIEVEINRRGNRVWKRTLTVDDGFEVTRGRNLGVWELLPSSDRRGIKDPNQRSLISLDSGIPYSFIVKVGPIPETSYEIKYNLEIMQATPENGQSGRMGTMAEGPKSQESHNLQESPKPESKELSFSYKWPAGLKASVEMTQEKGRNTDGLRGKVNRNSARFNMSVQDAGDGSRTVTYDFRDLPTPADSGGNSALQNLFASFQALKPTLIINKDGQLASIRDVDKLQAVARKFVAEALGGETLPDDVRQLLENVLSAETLTVAAGNDWSSLVGFWAGKQLEPGETYLSEETAPFPLPGAPEVMLTTRIEVEGPVACGAQNRKMCALIKTTSRPDVEQTRKILNDFFGKVTKDTGTDLDISYKDLDVTTSTTLLTEINTLIPHDYRTERVITMILNDPEGNEHVVSQTERRHSEYTYY